MTRAVTSSAALRASNLRMLVDVLRREGRLTRSGLSAATGLSRQTVSALLADLREQGLVEQSTQPTPLAVRGRQQATSPGRPPATIALATAAGAAVGADIGRRHVRVAVADLSHRVLAERQARFDVDGRATQALDLVAALVNEAIDEAGVDRSRVLGVGVGVPAPIDRGGLLGTSRILPGWTKLTPGVDLAERLGLPVLVENDANLGGLAEARYGAGRGHPDVLYLKLATGIGGALVFDGRLHRGSGGLAGEVGHTTVSDTGAICRCGNRGCLELVAGGTALVEALRHTGVAVEGIPDIIALAEQGSPGCHRVLTDAGGRVGIAIANVVKIVDPSIVVIGGELAAAGDLLLDPIRAALRQTGLAGAQPPVTPAVLGESAEALGGVLLVLNEPHRVGATAMPGRLVRDST